MGKRFGICCILLGVCCLLAAVGLIGYNRWEEQNARDLSQSLLQDVRDNILQQAGDLPAPEAPAPEPPLPQPGEPVELPALLPQEPPEEQPREMPTAQVNGQDCIGILSIPVLELELPVLTDWSYAKLKIAPCHYFGSCYEPNFVIAAHNYRAHFKRLPELQPKDLILFTDISGTVYCYEVVLLETLPAHATEEMITSGFDLSLYTCTPGRANRVTVRCTAVTNR